VANDVIAELKELREAVVSASEHTKRQLESVDSSLLAKSLFAIAISLGISFLLKIALYWIPVSLLVMPLWGLFSLKTILRPFQKKQIRKAQEAKQKLGDKQLNYGFAWLFENIAPMVKGLSMIYVGAFLVFIGVLAGIIHFEEELPKVVPLVTISIYLLSPLSLPSIIGYSEKIGFGKNLETFFSMSDKNSLSIGRMLLFGGITMTVVLLLAFMIFGLPIWSLLMVQNIFLPFSTESWLLILVFFFQLVTVAMFSSYFSSLSARKELTNTLTNLASIDYQISGLILDKNIKEEAVLELKNLFLTAKRYELVISNYLLFFPYYFLAMSKEHIRQVRG
jgi:hypothetical protein